MTFRFGQLVLYVDPGAEFYGRLARVTDYWWGDTGSPPVVGIRFVSLEGEDVPRLICGEAVLVAADIPKEEDAP